MTLRNGLSEELNRQGNEHFSKGYYTEAYTCYAKALECDRLSGDQRALVATLGNLGNICAVSGRRDSAQAHYQEVLELQKSSAMKKASERRWPTWELACRCRRMGSSSSLLSRSHGSYDQDP